MNQWIEESAAEISEHISTFAIGSEEKEEIAAIIAKHRDRWIDATPDCPHCGPDCDLLPKRTKP